MIRWRALPFALCCILALGCGDGPTTSGQNSDALNPLAGGGRLRSHDPMEGSNYTDSLPVFPDPGPNPWPQPWPDTTGTGWYTIFVSDFDCAEDPGEVVIDNAEDWKIWWEEATDCVWIQDSSFAMPTGAFGDTLIPEWPPDSSHPGDPGNGGPPPVDFEHYLIAGIRLPFDSGQACMRGAYVQTIETEGGETVIYYEVFQLEGDCCDMLMRPLIIWAGSPVVAVAFERPASGEIRFVRSDVVTECSMPDPEMPISLHFTDTPCDLGADEQLISDWGSWDEWYRSSISCDSARWSHGFPGRPEWPDTVASDSVFLPPQNWWWGTPEVDFENFAVIILRAGEQTRWGGGIWLTDVREGVGVSTIEYCVMEPGESCPLIDVDPGRLQPTTAIRIKKPASDQIVWQRNVEPIDCNWGVDSVLIDPF